jgi:hypothetical protein
MPALGSSGGLYFEIRGAEEVLRAVDKLSREVDSVHGKSPRTAASGQMRDAARVVSERGAAKVATGRYASGAGQAYKVSRTARAKRDRLPVVRIPGVRIGLSGQSTTGRRSAKGNLLNYRTKGLTGRREDVAIAWAATGGKSNPRFPGSTYWLNAARGDMQDIGVDAYEQALTDIVRAWGLM